MTVVEVITDRVSVSVNTAHEEREEPRSLNTAAAADFLTAERLWNSPVLVGPAHLFFSPSVLTHSHTYITYTPYDAASHRPQTVHLCSSFSTWKILQPLCSYCLIHPLHLYVLLTVIIPSHAQKHRPTHNSTAWLLSCASRSRVFQYIHRQSTNFSLTAPQMSHKDPLWQISKLLNTSKSTNTFVCQLYLLYCKVESPGGHQSGFSILSAEEVNRLI